MFCDKEGFLDLDEVYSHQITITANGKSICPKLTPMQDSQELFPMRIFGRKYAPKNHDGIYMMLKNDGTISKTRLVKFLLGV